MGRISHYPESGVRIEISRGEAGPPWRYEGHAVTPDAHFPLECVVEVDRSITVLLAPEAPQYLVHQVRFVVLAVFGEAKQHGEEGPPPEKITRWRAMDRPSRPGGVLG
jgi:hypothetical protein